MKPYRKLVLVSALNMYTRLCIFIHMYVYHTRACERVYIYRPTLCQHPCIRGARVLVQEGQTIHGDCLVFMDIASAGDYEHYIVLFKWP